MSLRIARSSNGKSPTAVAEKIVSQLRNIGGASHIGFGKERVMSLADAIAKALAEDLALNRKSDKTSEMVPLNLTEESGGIDDIVSPDSAQALALPLVSPAAQADLCPECGQSTLVLEEGCSKCYSCGFSKC